MALTTFINNLDPEIVKSSLASFDNIENEVNEIKKLSTVSTDNLVPKEFFDGVDLSTIDNSVLDKYADTINRIKIYIDSVVQADGETITTETTEPITINGFGDGSMGIDLAAALSSAINGLSQGMDYLQQLANKINGANEFQEPVDLAKAFSDAFAALKTTMNTILSVFGSLFTSIFGISLFGSSITTDTSKKKANNYSGGSYSYGGSSGGEVVNVDTESTDVVVETEEVTEEVPVETTEAVSETTEAVEEGLVNETQEDVAKPSLDIVNGKKVVNKVIDSNGNVVAVSTVENGKKTWHQVSDNQVVSPTTGLTSYNLNKAINIIDNGQTITIEPGTYSVETATYNTDGSLKSVRINYGDYRLVLGFNSNGDIDSINYIKSLTGVFSINNTDYDIYDSYGNIIGKYNNGQYYIYDTMYNEVGEIVGFRLSPDGEYEQWLYVNGNTDPSEYAFYESKQSNEKTTVSMFEKNKGLFGLLGVLFVALGATVVMKKRVAKKEQQGEMETEEEYNSNEWEEQGLSTGNYPIYDVKRDDEGNITDARINPLDNEFEYWVKV